MSRVPSFDAYNIIKVENSPATATNSTGPHSFDLASSSPIRSPVLCYLFKMATLPKTSKRKLNHDAPVSPPPLKRKVQSTTTSELGISNVTYFLV